MSRSIEENTEEPLVSVIIPTRNRAQSLKRAVDSVLKQDYHNLEVIVVDDASSDNTLQAIQSEFDDSRLRYIRHDTKKGGAAARNSGIRSSRGEFIAFLDDDDEWAPEKISLQLSVFSAGSSRLGLVHCGQVRCRDGKVLYKVMPRHRGGTFSLQLFEDRMTGTPSWLVRRSCFFDERVGMFDENLPARQDYDMALRISRLYEIDFVPRHLLIVHEDEGNRISDNTENRIAGHLRVLEKVKEYSAEFNAVARRRILSSHYYSIANHLLKYGHFARGTEYLRMSLREWPFNTKTLIIYCFAALGDRELRFFDRIVVLLRFLKGIYSSFWQL